MRKFSAAGWNSPPILRVSHKGSGEGEGGGDSPHLAVARQEYPRREYLWSEGGYRSIILRENPYGTILYYRIQFRGAFRISYDSVTENACRNQIFWKIYLKFVRDTFFPIQGLWLRERLGGSIFWWGVYPTERGNSNFLDCRESPHPNSILGLLTLMISKIVSESVFF